MTVEEAKKIFLNRGYVEVSGGTYYDADKWRESIVVISEWLEQEPCDDCVSRQAAIDAMIRLEQDDIERYGCAIPEGFNSTPAIEALNNLPSVTIKEKIGKWKVQHTNLSHLLSDTIVTCLKCGHTKSRIDGEILNFCPNCGARMMN